MSEFNCILKFVLDKYTVHVVSNSRLEASLEAIRKLGSLMVEDPNYFLENGYIIVVPLHKSRGGSL